MSLLMAILLLTACGLSFVSEKFDVLVFAAAFQDCLEDDVERLNENVVQVIYYF